MRPMILIILVVLANISLASNDVPNLNRPGNEFCFETDEVCVDTEPRLIEGEWASPACWEWTKEFTCYTYPQNTDCTVEENALTTVRSFDHTYTPLLNDFGGPGIHLPVAWKDEKEGELLCEIDSQYGCTDWYLTEDDYYAKTCYTEELMECQPDNCLVLSESCTAFDSGVCVMESVSFTCNAGSVCTGTGIDAVSELGIGMEEYIAANSVADVVAEYSEVNDATGEVTLFTGEAESCKAMTSAGEDAFVGSSLVCAGIAAWVGLESLATFCLTIGDLAASDTLRCCKDDPADINGLALEFGYCDDGDIELAVARKTKRAVQIGAPVKNECVCATAGVLLQPPADYRGSDLLDAFFSCSHLCMHPYRFDTLLNENVTFDRREEWCKFNDPLAKLIQEQGREQIEAIINSPVSTKSEMHLNPTYISSLDGKWSSSVDVAGNVVHFWEWDSQCAIPEESYDAQASGTIFCPSTPSQIIAVCSDPESGCGNLPSTPKPAESKWDMQLLLHGDSEHNQYVNKYIRVKGQCIDSTLDGIMDDCDWDVFGLPAGIGSQSIVNLDLKWTPHLPLGDDTAPEFQWLNKFSTASLEIQTVSSTHLHSDPASPRARVRQIGASSWTEIALNQGAETLYVDPSGTEVTFYGECSRYACNYTASTTHNLTLKPWYTYVPNQETRYTVLSGPFGYKETRGVDYGERYIPHCEGFSLEEFLALDISKMDLSDYLDTLNEEAREKIRRLIVD